MTPATLQALRRLLFFSVDEAAAMIGGVSPRSWQFWERGDRTIPADVIAIVGNLCRWRSAAIDAAENQIYDLKARHRNPNGLTLVWYQTIGDWATLPGRDPLQWRPQCSVIAAIAASHSAKLVAFDGAAYRAWLENRTDTESMRGAWAAAK